MLAHCETRGGIDLFLGNGIFRLSRGYPRKSSDSLRFGYLWGISYFLRLWGGVVALGHRKDIPTNPTNPGSGLNPPPSIAKVFKRGLNKIRGPLPLPGDFWPSFYTGNDSPGISGLGISAPGAGGGGSLYRE